MEKSVESFLKKAETIEILRLLYNENFFIHIQDNEELKQHWETIEKALINDRYIWLFSDTNILLPKGSMSEIEYADLSSAILRKVKNVAKN